MATDILPGSAEAALASTTEAPATPIQRSEDGGTKLTPLVDSLAYLIDHLLESGPAFEERAYLVAMKAVVEKMDSAIAEAA